MPARKNRPDKCHQRKPIAAPRPAQMRQPREAGGRYIHRSLPCCDPQGRHMAWCVVGEETDDVGGVGGGVLEWCYDRADALDLIARMERFPLQFRGLQAHEWEETGARKVRDLIGF